MKKRFTLLLLFIGIIITFYNIFNYQPTGTPIAPADNLNEKIILVPLDGRPPCRQFVIDAGKIGGYDVITPPSELQDYYSYPGESEKLQSWLEENASSAKAIIISTDQLLYGGLLAAREKDYNPEKAHQLLDYLQKLHQKNPGISIYAFSILPRMTPPDSIDGYYEKRYLMDYSRLLGKKHSGQTIDEAKLTELEKKISPVSREKYLSRFTNSADFNKKLIELLKDGTLKFLVLGQDDGEKYSLPNIEKDDLTDYIKANSLSKQQVMITHGADEIALSILARIKNQENAFSPRIYTRYNTLTTETDIMPYMAVSTGETTNEKIQLVGGTRVTSPQDADFTLFISANNEKTLSTRQPSVNYLKEQLSAGQPIAIVDLSHHFQGQETIFPFLLKSDVPLENFIAYAGWNTTSNAIGTAISQASLFMASKKLVDQDDDVLSLYKHNLTFLNNRYLEDYYYLKDVIDLINTQLKKAGYENTADLDLEHNYRYATSMLETAMQKRIAAFKQTKAFKAPVNIRLNNTTYKLSLYDLKADMSFPWPRTFEINLKSTIYLQKLP